MSFKKKWNKMLFIKDVQEKCMPQEAEALIKLLEWTEKEGELAWGDGVVSGSFTYTRKGCPVFTAYSNCRVELHFAHISKQWTETDYGDLKRLSESDPVLYASAIASHRDFDDFIRAIKKLQ